MSEEITIFADDKQIRAPKGSLLIEVLVKNHISIPHFCYHPSLGVDGNCRMCMVEIEGQKRPQIACDTTISEGMKVSTTSENIQKVKRGILELELVNHPVDCPICDQAGECSLQDYYMEAGLYESSVNTPKLNKAKHVDLGNDIVLDQERCVLCTRCTRFTEKVSKTNEFGVVSRGDHSRIEKLPGIDIKNPYALNVVDLCPVGALTSKNFRFKQRVWFLQSANSICQTCSKGCNITIDYNREKYKDAQIYRFRPRVNEEVNGYFICDEGRLSYNKENQNRNYDAFFEDKIQDLTTTINAFKTFINTQDSDKTLILVSPSLFLEDIYAIKKIAKDYNIAMQSYADYYMDGTTDHFLKTKDRASNRKTIELFNIATDEESFKQSLADCENLIIFNHQLLYDKSEYSEILKEKKLYLFTSHKSLFDLHASTIVPIASYSESMGTMINCDNRLQKLEQSIIKKKQVHNLRSLLAQISFESSDDDKLWLRLSEEYSIFAGISLASISSQGLVLKQ